MTAKKSIELLEKYDVTATLFLVTSWIKPDKLKSDKLYLESHSHNMHNQYECKGYGSQGGGILCLDREYVLNDLKTSQEILGGSTYFAYPFFDFSDRAISLLKEAGFKMAFIGQYDTDGYSYPNKTDLFKVRRKTIFSDTSMNEFISYLK
jgi:peptidoglycan/xylan/chitin deacetylase (PgdA/CDA1 family)